MPAQTETCGVRIAEMRAGVPIPEIGVAVVATLDDMEDVHFGMSDTKFNAIVPNAALWGLGARSLDIFKRGGRTAENSWQWLGHAKLPLYCTMCSQVRRQPVGWIFPDLIQGSLPSGRFYCRGDFVNGVFEATEGVSKLDGSLVVSCPHCPPTRAGKGTVIFGLRDGRRPAQDDFEHYFAAFNASREVQQGKDVYPPQAKMSGVSVGGERKYARDAFIKSEVADSPKGRLQTGVRWSKTALEHALERRKGKIHFHLDGLGDISRIIDKSGDHAYNVTGRELRYVYRNWPRFKDSVIFYNGYTPGHQVVRVQQPW